MPFINTELKDWIDIITLVVAILTALLVLGYLRATKRLVSETWRQGDFMSKGFTPAVQLLLNTNYPIPHFSFNGLILTSDNELVFSVKTNNMSKGRLSFKIYALDANIIFDKLCKPLSINNYVNGDFEFYLYAHETLDYSPIVSLPLLPETEIKTDREKYFNIVYNTIMENRLGYKHAFLELTLRVDYIKDEKGKKKTIKEEFTDKWRYVITDINFDNNKFLIQGTWAGPFRQK